MFNSPIQETFFLPVEIQETLYNSQHQCQSGLDSDSGYAHVLKQDELLIWKYANGKDAAVKRLACPSVHRQKCFIRVLPQASDVSVVLCTSDGRLFVWLDTSYLSQPVTKQIFISGAATRSDVVAALAAIPSEQATGPGFIAVVGTTDGDIYLHQVNASGVFTKQFTKHPAQSHGSLGIVSKVGGLLGSMYAEAFNPLSKVQRPAASSQPAIAISLQRVDASRYRLLVLTEEALDCWMVSLGVRSSEELQWSYALQQVLQSELQKAGAPPAAVTPLALAATPAGDALYVWSLSAPKPSAQLRNQPQQPQHHVHRLNLCPISTPKYAPAPTAVTTAAAGAVSAAAGHRMVVNGQGTAVLLQQPDGTVSQVDVTAGAVKVHLVAADRDNLAVAAAAADEAAEAQPGGWLVLSATYGVLQLSLNAGSGQQAGGGALVPEQEAAIAQLLDTTISLMCQARRAGRQRYHRIALGLHDRLLALGLFASDRNLQLLADYSRDVCDQVSKHWLAGSRRTAAAGVSLGDQLEDKGMRHQLLLEALAAAGVLRRLPPQLLARMLQDGEKLAAVTAVLLAQGDMLSEDVVGGGEVATVAAMQRATASAAEWQNTVRATSKEVVTAAGNRCRTEAEHGLTSGKEAFQQSEELFYSRPTAAADALLAAVAELSQRAAEHLLQEAAAAATSHSLHSLTVVRKLLAAALGAAAAKRQAYMDILTPDETRDQQAPRRPDWLCDEAARACWDALCQALVQLAKVSSNKRDCAHALLEAVGGLLATYRCALADAENHALLLPEYQQQRSCYAEALLEQCRHELQQQQTDIQAGSLAQQLEALCLQHHCYAQLYNLLQHQAQHFDQAYYWSRTLHLMASIQAEPLAPQHYTFAWYVFEQLEGSGNVKGLLGLPEGFRAQLEQYLQQKPQLLWMLQAKGREMGAAAQTLLHSGQSERDCSARRDTMCLARLAAHAAGDAALGSAAASELHLLGVQAQLGVPEESFLGVSGIVAQAVSADSVQQNPVLALRALLTVEPPLREAQLAEQWEAAWGCVLQLTDLEQLVAAYRAGEGYEQRLRDSVLFNAVRECMGKHGFGATGGAVSDESELLRVQQRVEQWAARAGAVGVQCAMQAVRLACDDAVVAGQGGGGGAEDMVM